MTPQMERHYVGYLSLHKQLLLAKIGSDSIENV